jgi:translation initiation factor IF-3
VHDLENKKRKAIEFLKQYTTLKFFMKVNVYDEANIQKGRLMLLNIAEDLKDLAKIKVSPANMTASEETEGKSEKKPKSFEEVSKKSKASFVNAD